MRKKKKSDYIIQSVWHSLDLLEEFTGDTDELGVTELSKRLNLHKNNIFRLLATLETRGYIEQNKATENYRLGLKALELGQTFIKQLGLLKQAKPVMKKVADKCNETTYVGVLRARKAVYLDALEGLRPVRVVSRIGHWLPPHATAIGKIQLAFESEDEIERFIDEGGLEKYTENTITDKAELLEHLKKVIQDGYAVDNEEYDKEVKCVAAPIRDYTKRVIAGISISAPASRMSQERIEKEMAPLVIEAGKEISNKLGYEVGLKTDLQTL
jgi:DNA-binding IclR family transcriptional regulator